MPFQKQYLIGMAETVITPPVGVNMAGYAPRVARGVHDELKAVAVVFDDWSGRKSAICSVDVCVVNARLVTAVRRRVAVRTAMRLERIMIAATHLHSGPKLSGDNLLNQRWLIEFEDKLVQVIQEADMLRRDARIGFASGEALGIGGNRRDPRHGPVDRSVSVVRIDDARTNKIMGVIVNHACHVTTLDLHNLLLTADYPGQMRNYVHEHLQDRPCVMFLNGACGDINPGGYSAEDSALGKAIPNRTFERAHEIGVILGREAVRLVKTIKPESEFEVQGGLLSRRLPMRKAKLPAEARLEAEEMKRQLSMAESAGITGRKLDRLRLECMYSQEEVERAECYARIANGEFPMDIQGISVKDILFLGLSGEMFNEIGSQLRRESPFKRTVVVGYANECICYFPTVAALSKGGYEVRCCMFGAVAIKKMIGWASLLARGLHASLLKTREQKPDRETASPGALIGDPLLKAPVTDVRKARFPAIDFHLHCPGVWRATGQKLADMDATNVRYVVDMFGDTMPQADFLPALWEAEREQGRILHFFGFDFGRIECPDWPDYVREKINHDMKLGGRGIKIFKELGLEYRDGLGRLIMPDDKRLKPVWDEAAKRGLPVLYHIADPTRNFKPIGGTYEELKAMDDVALFWKFGAPGYPKHEELLAAQERMVAANPKTTFVLAHLAALDSDLKRCGNLLRKYPNIYVDTAARLWELGRQPHCSREFFLAYADRIIWGTDQSWPNQHESYPKWFRFFETSDDYFPCALFGVAPRMICGIGLPDKALKKIYRETAARLLNLSLK